MPRFKSSADILKIVSNKDQVRNIGIIAHVDHGKCVSGNSLVSISDGSIREIKGLYERLRSNGPARLEVDSLDSSTLTMQDQPVSHVVRLKSDKLVTVTLSNGF